MRLSLYLDRDTWVHRLHPVVRVLGMLAVFVVAFVIERPQYQLLPAGLLGAALLHTGALANIRRLRALFVMVFVMTTLIWTVFYGPDGQPPLLRLGTWEVSRTAPWFALGMAIKLSVFLGAGVLFLSTTRIEDFAYALGRLGLPYKVGFTITLAFRLVPVFLDAAGTVVQAQRCRGLDFDRGSPWQRLRRYGAVIVPVFMGALRRADGMAMTLEARGFQSTRPRTTLQRYRFRAADALALIALAAMTALYLVWWWGGALSFTVIRTSA
jgi:energy-coupling factor transport system permease protein